MFIYVHQHGHSIQTLAIILLYRHHDHNLTIVHQELGFISGRSKGSSIKIDYWRRGEILIARNAAHEFVFMSTDLRNIIIVKPIHYAPESYFRSPFFVLQYIYTYIFGTLWPFPTAVNSYFYEYSEVEGSKLYGGDNGGNWGNDDLSEY